MSNTLYIDVTEFKNLGTGQSSYGYTASDSYFSEYNNQYDSLEEFLQAFPTEKILVDTILNLEGFHSSDGCIGNIIVNYP